MKLDPYLTPYGKINSKQIKDLNVTGKTLKRKHRNKYLLLGLGNGFLAMKSKAQATKEERDKLDFIKIKKICAAESIIKKVKRTTQMMVENFYKSCI